MRDFLWKVFAITGNVQAYLLYKETKAIDEKMHANHQYAALAQERENRRFDAATSGDVMMQ